MDKIDPKRQMQAARTLLGGLATAVARISELEIEAKEKDEILSELTRAQVAAHQLWERSRQREAVVAEQLKKKQTECDLLIEEATRRQRIEKAEHEELRQEIRESRYDGELEPISDTVECPNCRGENLVRGVEEVCDCLLCGTSFQLRFDARKLGCRRQVGYASAERLQACVDVRHDSYGPGRIVESSGQGIHRRIRIIFGTESRTFLASKVKLVILDRS